VSRALALVSRALDPASRAPALVSSALTLESRTLALVSHVSREAALTLYTLVLGNVLDVTIDPRDTADAIVS